MSDKNINKMDFKGLRNEVQLLRDDIAKWKRVYEDMLYNLDTDNFSSRLVKEKNGMATAIEITAEGLKTKVSQEQLTTSLLDYSTITQTATQIELAVVSVNNLTDTKLENYSTITQTADAIQTEVATLENDIATKYSTVEQTAEAITSTVTAEYVNNLIGGGYVTNAMMMSQIEQSSEQILLSVSTEYETKDDADIAYEQLQANITLNSEQIQLKVSETDVDTKLSNYSTITQTATDISSAVSTERTYVTNLLDTDYYTQEQVDNLISVNADGIILEVSSTYQTKDDADDDYSYLSSRITTTNNKVSAIVSGDYTDDMLSGYLTGIEISPNQIKMIDNSVYSVYNSDGLRFYDSTDQIEGWAIEPGAVGGVLNYYRNNVLKYTFGHGSTGTGYSSTDMAIKALSNSGRFVVDVSDNASSAGSEVKFVGLYESGDTKYIYANEQLLATQNWVLANAGSSGGTATAVFG